MADSRYKGSGVHHIAAGVKSLPEMKSFYSDILETTRVFFEVDKMNAESMEGLLRTSPVLYDVVMFTQEMDGILIELVQMYSPVSRPIRKDFRYGDIGLSKITIAVNDVDRFYTEMKSSINFCSKPKHVSIPEWGDYHFVYCRDPENNLVEFFSDANIQGGSKFGGVRSVGISVTDLQRSISFYQKFLGLDKVVVKTHENFSGLVDEISGSTKTQVRSCVLANSKGGGMVELFEVIKPRGRSIPFSAIWGDFGYLQTCFYNENIHEMRSYFEKENIEFLCSLETMFEDIPKDAGTFFYWKDIDGIPLELLYLHQQANL